MRGRGLAAILTIVWFGPLSATEPATLVDRTDPPAEARSLQPSLPRIDSVTLVNGMRLITVERPGVPTAHLVWGVRSGSAACPADRTGVAELLAALVAVGRSGRRDSLGERLRDGGALLEVEVDRDSIRFSIQMPSRYLPVALGELRRALQRPDFSEAAIADSRRRLAVDWAIREADPMQLLDDAGWRAAFGSDHPYGRPTRGSHRSIEGLAVAALRPFHESHFVPENMFVVLAGDFTPERLRHELERFRPRRSPGATRVPPPALPPPERTDGPRIVLVDRPGSDRALVGLVAPLAQPVLALDPDAGVVDALLGGSPGSRLQRALRGELRVAYSAASWLQFSRAGGLLRVGSEVETADAAAALRRIWIEVRELGSNLDADELERARRQAGARGLTLFETNRQIARLLGRLEALGLDTDRARLQLAAIPQVDAGRVAGFMRDRSQTQARTLLVVGDAERLARPLAALGLGPVEIVDAKALGDQRETPGFSGGSPPDFTEAPALVAR